MPQTQCGHELRNLILWFLTHHKLNNWLLHSIWIQRTIIARELSWALLRCWFCAWVHYVAVSPVATFGELARIALNCVVPGWVWLVVTGGYECFVRGGVMLRQPGAATITSSYNVGFILIVKCSYMPQTQCGHELRNLILWFLTHHKLNNWLLHSIWIQRTIIARELSWALLRCWFCAWVHYVAVSPVATPPPSTMWPNTKFKGNFHTNCIVKMTFTNVERYRNPEKSVWISLNCIFGIPGACTIGIAWYISTGGGGGGGAFARM